MRTIPLSNSDLCVIIDDEDYEFLSQWKWKLHAGRYAARTTYDKSTKKFSILLMHRLLNGTIKGMDTHHVNENMMDNRRSNLETIDPREHQRLHSPRIVAFQKSKQIYPDYKNCANCGAMFKVNPRKRKRHKCCNHNCAQALRVDGIKRARQAKHASHAKEVTG